MKYISITEYNDSSDSGLVGDSAGDNQVVHYVLGGEMVVKIVLHQGQGYEPVQAENRMERNDRERTGRTGPFAVPT